MDAIDILGDLLGRKAGKKSRGSGTLTDIFNRRSGGHSTSQPVTHAEIRQQSEELENLLNVANDRATANRGHRTERSTSPAGFPQPDPSRHRPKAAPDLQTQNEQAVILIRAMVNAAKADGRLDRDEQQAIFDQLGRRSTENIEFLKQEFSRPLNVEQFVREVPMGMEQQVYAISLIAIDADTQHEDRYLQELADGLRIPLDIRQKLRQRFEPQGWG